MPKRLLRRKLKRIRNNINQLMKDFDNEELSKKKEPILLERGDGLGWTLNFDRPISYVILIVFILVVLTVLLYINGVFKF
jgi:hypothetical protein